jgi:hypothetical protein
VGILITRFVILQSDWSSGFKALSVVLHWSFLHSLSRAVTNLWRLLTPTFIQTYSLPEDRCVRLLIKNLGRRMPEGVVREELESLGILVQGVMQLRFGRRDQDPAKDRPPTPHIIVSVARGLEVSRVRSLTELCGLRISVETYAAPKGPVQCKRCQRFGHTQRNCGHAPRCVACGGSHLPGDCPALLEQPQCCICGGNHTEEEDYGACRDTVHHF